MFAGESDEEPAQPQSGSNNDSERAGDVKTAPLSEANRPSARWATGELGADACTLDALFGEWSQRHPAVFVGSIEVRRIASSGRGVFASRQLEPGTIVLAERPILAWSIEACSAQPELLGVRFALEQPDASAALTCLHPINLSDASPSAVGKAKRNYGGVRGDNALRLALVMQFNAFDSGVFARLSLFNHACEDAANCARLDAGSGFWQSEHDLTVILVTRPIARGEELTIGYEQPCETARLARRARLKARYDFDCVCTACAVANDTRDCDEKAVEDSITVLATSTDLARIDRLVHVARELLGDRALLLLRARRIAFNAALARLSNLTHSHMTSAADFIRAANDALSRGLEFMNHQAKALGLQHIDLSPTASALADVYAEAIDRGLLIHPASLPPDVLIMSTSTAKASSLAVDATDAMRCSEQRLRAYAAHILDPVERRVVELTPRAADTRCALGQGQ